jgi:hypothetical protein
VDLNDAIRHAVELEAFNSAERRLTENKGYLREVKPQEKSATGDTLNSLLKAVQEIQKEMNFIKMKIDKQDSGRLHPKVVTCHFCRKRGHMKKDCFHYKRLIEGKGHTGSQQKSTSQRKNSKDAGEKKNFSANRRGVSRKAGEAGIFVEAIMNGFRVKLLVDTGATLSIISPDILYSILNDPNPTLAPVDQPILMAECTALKVEGSISMPLMVSNLVFNQTFAVAHTRVDGILGLDFMTNND